MIKAMNPTKRNMVSKINNIKGSNVLSISEVRPNIAMAMAKMSPMDLRTLAMLWRSYFSLS